MKKIAVINDLSGLGKCSLTAAIPVISVLGVQACPLPTAILSNQTGYASYFYDDYTDKIDRFTDEWKKIDMHFDGISTGFLGSETQVEKILHFIDMFYEKDTLLFVDPVMGDLGHAFSFATDSFRAQMKKLALRADVITPNLTELCLLADVDFNSLDSKAPDYLEQIAKAGKLLLDQGIQTILVTGILYHGPTDTKEKYYNMILTNDGFETVSSEVIGGSYSGTGDLMAAALCAGMVRGDSAYESTKRAVNFITAALKDTVKAGTHRNEGINFEKYLNLLW